MVVLSGLRNMIILDGGMGHQLKRMGVKIEGPVGSMQRFLGVAMANVDQPSLVRDAHLAYIDAGAKVITSNSYAITPKHLELATEDDSCTLESLLAAACQRAVEAKKLRPGHGVRVAGCLPPLRDSYRADLVLPFDQLLPDYQRISRSIAPFCDLLLCETMSTAEEARAAATAAAETGLPIWVSWTLNESSPTLRSGESIESAVDALRGLPIAAYMFNCTSPEVVSEALPRLRDAPGLAPNAIFGAYANGFLTADTGTGEYRDLKPEEYLRFAVAWTQLGASVVGGCCGIFPEHISHLSEGKEAAMRVGVSPSQLEAGAGQRQHAQ